MNEVRSKFCRHVPTEATREIVSALAAYGIPKNSIAQYLDVTIDTLNNHYHRELIVTNLTKIKNVADTLYKKAVSGDVRACIFYLKARAGWTEHNILEHTNSDATVLLERFKKYLPSSPQSAHDEHEDDGIDRS